MKKAAALALLLTICGCPKNPQEADKMVSPPRAKKVAHTNTYHGVEYEDPYHWLRQRDDENVLNYLRAENKYVDFKMKHTDKLQKRLYDEMVGRKAVHGHEMSDQVRHRSIGFGAWQPAHGHHLEAAKCLPKFHGLEAVK